MTLIPEDWIKSINKSKNYWENQAEKMQQYHARFSNTFTKVNNQFNHSRGAHTLQMMFVCEIDDDGTITRYNQYGYDGVNFISFDLKTQTWTAATPQAENFTPTLKSTEYWMNYTEDVCLDLLKTFVLYAKGEEKRNGRPQASVFQKHSPPPAVVCLATGFFPKALNISVTWAAEAVRGRGSKCSYILMKGKTINKQVEIIQVDTGRQRQRQSITFNNDRHKTKETLGLYRQKGNKITRNTWETINTRTNEQRIYTGLQNMADTDRTSK